MSTSSSKFQTCQSDVLASAFYVQSHLPESYVPTVGIIGGSGLAALEDIIAPFEPDSNINTTERPVSPRSRLEIGFDKIPGFPIPTTSGHAGKLIFGTLITKHHKRINTVVMSGRGHFYEGNDPQVATFPIRVLGALKISALIITNAAGGLNETYRVGDIMILNDHISFPSLSGTYNPLLGPLDPSLGTSEKRFLALSDAYDHDLRRAAWQAWKSLAEVCTENETGNIGTVGEKKRGRRLHEGVYAFVAGPTYETRAESRLLSRLGADVVGMSTVPEVIVARHIGVRVLGISLVTNMAVLERVPRGDDRIKGMERIGYEIEEGKANHTEVLEAGKIAAEFLKNFIVDIVELESIREVC